MIVFANIAVGGLGLLTVPMITRGVGADGRGQTAAAITAFNIIPILLAFGMPLAIRHRATRGYADAAVRTFRQLSLVSFVPAAFLGVVVSKLLFARFDTSLQLLVTLGILAAPFTMSWMGDASVLVARGNYRSVALLRVAPSLTLFLGIGAAYVSDLISVSAILMLHIASAVVTASLGLAFVRISWRGERLRYSEVMREGSNYAGAGLAEAAAYRLDQALLLPLVGSVQLGLYSVAVTIASVPDALGQALGAPFYRRMAAEPRGGQKSLATEAVQAASSLSIATAAILGLCFVPALPWIFGSSFAAGRAALVVVLIGSAALIVARVAALNLAAVGNGRAMTLAQTLGLGVGLLLLPSAAGAWGAVGAAVASSAGFFVTMTMAMRSLQVRASALVPSLHGLTRAVNTLSSRE